ncbi:MAG: long-chain fatty acid--CoA ligase [Pseudolysinimonas sp.]
MTFDPIAGLRRRLDTEPDADVLISATSSLTVSELWDSAARCAALLATEGIGPGAVVGVELPPLLQPVFAVALWMRGAIGAIAPVGRGEELGDVLDVMVGRARREGFPAERFMQVDDAWLMRSAELDPTVEPFQWADNDIARVVFSSGTTGAPKPIAFTVADLEERVNRGREFWMPTGPFLTILGIGAVSGSATFFAALEGGIPYLVGGTSAENVAVLAKTGVPLVHGSPIQLSDLLSAAGRTDADLPGLRIVQSVGGVLSEELAARLVRRFGAEIEIIYGSTEVGGVTLRRGAPIAPGDVGAILPFATIEAVGAEGEPVADGEEGLIRVRRPRQARGSFRGMLDDATFRDGWFFPGDVGRIADGHLIVVGRRDELINAAGIKVDPERVERVALRFPGVGDAVAVGVEDARGVSVVALAVVADSAVDLAELRAALVRELGDAAPRVLERIAVVPRTVSGKARRLEVAADLRARLGRAIEF